MSAVTLVPGSVTLTSLEEIYRNGQAVTIDRQAKTAVDTAAERVRKAAAGEEAVYGVNTGFGKLASVKIAPDDTATLQRNLILSHCCGVGEELDEATVRLIMTLKLLSLARGASGVRWDILELIEQCLEKGVTPVIPSQGSVGASGDLAPLAHMTAVLIGEGEAIYAGERMTGAEALEQAGLAPVILGPKEGLGLINGTQVSTAFALIGLFEAVRMAEACLITASLSTDAIMGSTAPLLPEIHALRGHRGQIEVACTMRELMAGSEIRKATGMGTAACRTPIASAASHRWSEPVLTLSAWRRARWKSKRMPRRTIRWC